MNRYNFAGFDYYRMPVICYLGYHEWVREPNDKSGIIPEDMRHAMTLHAKSVGANSWKASPILSTSDYWFVEFIYDARLGDLQDEQISLPN